MHPKNYIFVVKELKFGFVVNGVNLRDLYFIFVCKGQTIMMIECEYYFECLREM